MLSPSKRIALTAVLAASALSPLSTEPAYGHGHRQRHGAVYVVGGGFPVGGGNVGGVVVPTGGGQVTTAPAIDNTAIIPPSAPIIYPFGQAGYAPSAAAYWPTSYGTIPQAAYVPAPAHAYAPMGAAAPAAPPIVPPIQPTVPVPMDRAGLMSTLLAEMNRWSGDRDRLEGRLRDSIRSYQQNSWIQAGLDAEEVVQAALDVKFGRANKGNGSEGAIQPSAAPGGAKTYTFRPGTQIRIRPDGSIVVEGAQIEPE